MASVVPMASVVGSSPPAEVKDPSDPIVMLLATIAQDAQGLVAGADRLEEALASKNLLYEQKIAPRNIGFHPLNRGGEGGNPLEVLRLASEIGEVGFSEREVRHALCIQAAPGDRTIEDFNIKLVAETGIAPVDPDTILYGSLSGGHLNAVLRCIAASVPSGCKFLAEGGFMSVDKIRRRSPQFATAAEEGIVWKVLKWQVAYLYPQALTVISMARNMTAALSRSESEIQGLLRLHALSAAAQRRQEEPPWSAIKASVLRSKPAYAGSLDKMISFVITRAGGIDGKFLTYLSAFYRNHVDKERRSLPSAVYAALAEFPHHSVAIALFVAAWQSPSDQVQQGVCRGVTAAEISSLAKSPDTVVKQRLRSAEEALAASRARLAQAGVHQPWDSTRLCKCFARLDVSMARFLLGKQDRMRNKHDSVASVMKVFVLDLKATFADSDVAPFADLLPGADAGVASVADAGQSERPKTAGPSEAKLVLYETTTAGVLVDPLARLRAKGMDIGRVVTKADTPEGARPSLFKIADVLTLADGRRQVRLAPFAEDAEMQELDLAAFLDGWILGDPKDHHERIAAWDARRPANMTAAQTLLRRAHIQVGLGHLMKQGRTPTSQDLTLWCKPRKFATASVDFAVGELVLVPETTTIRTRERVDRPGALLQRSVAEAEVGFAPADPKWQHFLQPPAQDMLSPFWHVTPTSDPGAANMRWTTASVQLLSAHFYPTAIRPVTAPLPVPAVPPLQAGEAAASGSAAVSAASAAASVQEDALGAASVDALAKSKGALPKATAKAQGTDKGQRAEQTSPNAKLRVAEGDEEDEEGPEHDTAQETFLTVPVLVNSAGISVGDVLAVYQPPATAPEKRPREAAPISVVALSSKRARTT